MMPCPIWPHRLDSAGRFGAETACQCLFCTYRNRLRTFDLPHPDLHRYIVASTVRSISLITYDFHMHTTIEHLRQLFDYLCWGDRLAVEAAGAVTEEEYYRERGISAGSIHKLLVHVMAAEWVWLSRWRGTSPTRLENHQNYPTRAALETRWPRVHTELCEFLERQTPESLADPLVYRSSSGEGFTVALGHSMIHVVDHSTYHRGQLNTMIKQAGGVPASASYIIYQARSTNQS